MEGGAVHIVSKAFVAAYIVGDVRRGRNLHLAGKGGQGWLLKAWLQLQLPASWVTLIKQTSELQVVFPHP